MASTHNPSKPVATIEKDGDDLLHESQEHEASVRFKYTPLPNLRAFRLLVLQPGPPNSRLECKLNIYDLDKLDTLGAIGQFTAISYTWNASDYDSLIIKSERIPTTHEIHSQLDIRHPIFCDDKRLLISTSLYNLLRRMRNSTYGIALWIDAICINQDDADERASQVLLMHDIYGHADGVVMWLGEEDDKTEMAFALAKKLVLLQETDSPGVYAMPTRMSALDLYNSSRLVGLGLPPIDAPDYQALFGMFERPVFRRSWILQEMALSKSPPVVLCGNQSMLFAKLVGSTAYLKSCGWLELLESRSQEGEGAAFNAHSYADDIMRIRYQVKYNNKRPHIALVVNFEATDPRDKIYAMLGLMQLSDMPAKSQALLHPDYRRSVDDIYRDATIAFICAENSLAVLALAGDHTGIAHSLPSWVPNYAPESKSSFASLIGHEPESCKHRASGRTTPGAVAVLEDPRKLSLRAFCAATVVAVAAEDPHLTDFAQLLEWISMVGRLPLTYTVTGEEVEDALSCTLVGNCSPDHVAEQDFSEDSSIGDSFKGFISVTLLRMIRDQSARPPTREMLLGYERFQRSWMFNMVGRRLFLTQNGLMGMGCPALKVGDKIYVVAGAMVPFVVRREGARQKLVGDCYVHGIMNGECLGWKEFTWKGLVLE